MTQQTEDLIKKFCETRDLMLVPSIIIGMQEEDNVGNVIHFKNCFRQLRNIAAHEPATITSQINTGLNVNNTKLVFTSKDTEILTVLSIEQFTAWMFDMYMITSNIAYIVFWKTLLKVLYPSIYKENYTEDKFQFDSDVSRILPEYGRLINYMYDKFGELWPINIGDPYIRKMIVENPKVFWRMAVPNMFIIIKLFLNNYIDVRSRTNVQMFLALFQARD